MGIKSLLGFGQARDKPVRNYSNGEYSFNFGQSTSGKSNPDADRTRLIPPPEQDTPRQEQDAEERLERKEYRQQENQGYQSEPSGSLIDTSALGAIDIFSVLMEDDHTHEYIDPAFRFGRRKKKKRRRKL